MGLLLLVSAYDLAGFRLGWAPLGLGWEHSRGERRTQWVTWKGEVHVSNSLYHAVLTFSQAICHGLLVAPPVHAAAGDPLCRQSPCARIFYAALLVA